MTKKTNKHEPTFFDVEQGTDEWFGIKAGIPSSSNFKKIVGAKSKVERKNLLYRLVAEQLTGKYLEDSYSNAHMERGHEMEPRARALHSLELGQDIRTVGFVIAGEFEPPYECLSGKIGASTDGLIGDDGVLEVKTTNSANQMRIIHSGKIPVGFRWQILGEMLVTGRKFCDFVSFDPDLEDVGMDYWHKRVKAEDDWELNGKVVPATDVWKELMNALADFVEEMKQTKKEIASPDALGDDLRRSLESYGVTVDVNDLPF